jgi:hypothetical protein
VVFTSINIFVIDIHVTYFIYPSVSLFVMYECVYVIVSGLCGLCAFVCVCLCLCMCVCVCVFVVSVHAHQLTMIVLEQRLIPRD